jgi:hypothetical protein
LAREISGATFAENGCSENKKRPPMQGLSVLAREISGATFAENGCSENRKPLTMQGLYVFGAGNQVRTGDLYLGKVLAKIFSIMLFLSITYDTFHAGF